MVSISAIFCGYILDLLLGDPENWPHPVRWIGKLINYTQQKIRAYCYDEQQLKNGGLLLWIIVVGSSYLICWLLLKALSFSTLLQWLAEVWLIYTLLATKCLNDAAMAVYHALQQGSLADAREKVSYIVGRDTSQLSEKQITRATVETVAENSVDGVIAPLFFLFIGGVPLAMAYKAVNTLDSVVGYTNPKYKSIGFYSAKIDDIANWIPARLSWLLLSAAAAICQLDYQRALKIGWRDRRQHKSPNCAWPEATVAGALGIQLNGPNIYFGEVIDKPWVGDAIREIELTDICRTNKLMYAASALALVIFSALFLLL